MRLNRDVAVREGTGPGRSRRLIQVALLVSPRVRRVYSYGYSKRVSTLFVVEHAGALFACIASLGWSAASKSSWNRLTVPRSLRNASPAQTVLVAGSVIGTRHCHHHPPAFPIESSEAVGRDP